MLFTFSLFLDIDHHRGGSFNGLAFGLWTKGDHSGANWHETVIKWQQQIQKIKSLNGKQTFKRFVEMFNVSSSSHLLINNHKLDWERRNHRVDFEWDVENEIEQKMFSKIEIVSIRRNVVYWLWIRIVNRFSNFLRQNTECLAMQNFAPDQW